jgi:hypothetical protein
MTRDLKTFSIRISDKLRKELGHFAVDADLSLNDVVRIALREWLTPRPNPAKYLGKDPGEIDS